MPFELQSRQRPVIRCPSRVNRIGLTLRRSSGVIWKPVLVRARDLWANPNAPWLKVDCQPGPQRRRYFLALPLPDRTRLLRVVLLRQRILKNLPVLDNDG
jgi:hypothetical protein